MRGSLTKRGEHSWSIVVDLGRDSSTGRRRQHRVSVRGTKREAEKRLAELIAEVDKGNFVRPAKLTVADYLDKWLADYARSNLSPRGFERYQGIIAQHFKPELGNIALTQLRPEHLQKHYTAKLNDGLSARTVRYHHAVIHVARKTAVTWGMLARNPADAVTVPKVRRNEMQTWDETEITRFVEGGRDSPYYELFYTALFTGMRRSELLGLSWRDVDLTLCQVCVSRSLHHLKDGRYVFTEPKSDKSRRTIALPPSLAVLLREYRQKRALERSLLGIPWADDALVFSTPEGKPLRPNTITRAWTTLAARLGLRAIRLHDARHSHASLLLKQGVHPKIVQERLGHSTIAITLDVYSHVAPGLQEAAARRFDDALALRQPASAPVGSH